MKIKICGITCLEDALESAEAGADMLGFNFYPKSARFIEPLKAARLIEALHERHSNIRAVGVFVNDPIDRILSVIDECRLDLAQLSGDEQPETLQALGDKAFKALRPKSLTDLMCLLSEYPPCSQAPAYLIDAYRPGQFGGTGEPADWELAHSMAETTPILLAGGLNPSNVAEAVQQVLPWGVDVASGVESSPGRKDPRLVKAFIRSARAHI